MNLFFSSFGLSVLLILLSSWIYRKIAWMDKPERYPFIGKRAPVPYGIGVIFFIVFMTISLFFLEISPKLIALIISGGILTLVSFFDDRMGLPIYLRLIIQIVCATIVILSGMRVPAITNPFGDPIVLDSIRWSIEISSWKLVIEPIADIVALVWITFVINALNWLDGSPGIVSGVSTIASTVLYILATMSDIHVINQSTLSQMAIIVGSSSLAFLIFDFPTPKILMGDSGTMFLGLMIAVMAIFSGGKMATAFIVLAIPLLDMVWTIARRLLKKKSPFKGDFQHFHHELLRSGFSPRQVNIFYYVISLGFGYSALSLESMGKLISIFMLFGLMVVIRMTLVVQRKW